MSFSWPLTNIFNPQPGWYCGELHAHSSHSDGRHSPAQLVELARDEGLDFLAITDHNSFDAFASPSPDPNFLIIPAMEVTLQNGHFNVYGFAGRLDWMEQVCIGLPTIKLAGNYPTATALMRRMAGQGLVTSINHPLRVPYEWRDGKTDLRNVHCLEIWNRPDRPEYLPDNHQSVALWTRWLNAGHRITAIGGSDFHASTLRPGETRPTERLGWPKNFIYAESLSGAAILAGLRQHRVYISMGPEVIFQARFKGITYGIGAGMGPVEGSLDFEAGVTACPLLARLQIIRNGEVIAEAPIEAEHATFRYSTQVRATAPAWYRLDVYDQQDQMLAITNPIFVGLRRRPRFTAYGDFVSGSG